MFLRAALRNYQLDVEIVKKWPGLKLSQNKAFMGPSYQMVGLSAIEWIFLTIVVPEA